MAITDHHLLQIMSSSKKYWIRKELQRTARYDNTGADRSLAIASGVHPIRFKRKKMETNVKVSSIANMTTIKGR